jgi:dienelactone hydrolase
MRSQSHVAKVKQSINRLFLLGCLSGIATSVLAQNESPTAITKLTTVDLHPIGHPPSGPYRVVVEHDPGLATHTIYRPSELSMDKHPVLVWGEGACAKNGLMFPEYLTEIASHGIVVVADGPPVLRPPGGPNATGTQGGPAPGGARPGGAVAGGEAGGPPNGASMVNGTALVAAIDWLEAESSNRDSRFYSKVDVDHVAAMGMSCGGLMSYGASNDRRVATVGIWNSGLLPNVDDPDANARIYDGIHGSVIIVTGGESDIAYANGKRDFELMPAGVPTFYGVYPSVGHGGTYNQDNGGPFGITAVAWLKWQLMGDTSAAGRGYFVGDDCAICKDSNWRTDARSLR